MQPESRTTETKKSFFFRNRPRKGTVISRVVWRWWYQEKGNQGKTLYEVAALCQVLFHPC